jgi:alpha-glucosidase (family GH31 glycosyl hydrolase)
VGPTVNRGVWNLPDEPHYNPEVIAAWRFYSKIKTALIDYSHVAAREANRTGTPIAKPLYLVYPDQPQAWRQWQTYLYGNDLLVSPVWETDKTQQTVYLPAGEQWIDLWTGQVYAGGQQLDVSVPLYKIPVFLKQGSSLQLPDFPSLWRESLAIAASRPDLKTLEHNENW